MEKHFWLNNLDFPRFKKLEGNKKTDVLIIGGGISGILCAYFLKQAGIDYILVEGRRIASGITLNTTAKITSLHGLIYAKLLKSIGQENAQKYLLANQSAVSEYVRLCKDIDCDFEAKPAYTYSLKNRKKIEEEVEAINSLGAKAKFCHKTELPFSVKGAICMPGQAQSNPLKFLAEISKDLNIYENTFIRKVTQNSAKTENGTITAKKIIIATHFPFINMHGAYFLKMYQHRSYVIALKNAQKLDGIYVDEDDKGLSFREYKGLVLLGGGGHRTGKNGGNWNELNEFKQKYYPESTVLKKWATQDCMSLDSIPYIGRYSPNTPDLYVATGFNKWGMTSSMVAAKILCDLVQEKTNDFADVFDPSRSILKPQLLVNGIETLLNFATPVTKRCPHLGCALKWNKAEHTWDCPCHGSRFNEKGDLIDNPATHRAKNLD